MSYQVLARKWRPKSFDDMVGQQHVVRALANALDRGQLHHAYLFTGTRGVGKTTLARILAKSLNCEQGVSAHPCGQCATCREVDAGRFVDLIEVDAASRTKVDQTRELLDNVPYAPAHGRYKVYLIDEVHMFSAHSFNALLKTLEEPPPHVKFLLATTDPQRLPVTVLSRCLQFNLRRLLPDEIGAHLRHVLETEGLAFESPALAQLARAADGSMRDALSLLDQAIAFGGGQLVEAEVRAMLGTLDGEVVLALVEALASGDGAALLAEVERVAALTPDYAELLRELIALLHRLALVQQVPRLLAADDPDGDRLGALAARLSPEDVQLYYQVALTGQGDLALAPDPRAGLEMVLLRALAFRPASPAGQPDGAPAARRPPDPRPAPPAAPRQSAPAPSRGPNASGTPPWEVAAPAPLPAPEPSAPASVAAVPAAPSPDSAPAAGVPPWEVADPSPISEPSAPAPAVSSPRAPVTAPRPDLRSPAQWQQLVAGLRVRGIAGELAHNCGFLDWADGRLLLSLDPAVEHLRVPTAESRLREALEGALGEPVRLEFQIARPEQETLAQRRVREAEARQRAAEETMYADPVAERMREQLAADWVPGSIEPQG
ncbi:DNA polymerase III subunit gamma/tau [Marichromatium purpuratum 984]|uniref:DNA polymerase III subunit gamma/tau n=1 Tax=Marichromatium purpuratum 984 TaxID=765910 RepID=W0E1A4_MARPU|nr:DNA polymerase III subunit gamma/tau [Marichromatium purpuratum]AHF03288.1 DNA polymerase III subunit gamma/tau [Marichromatium purpuratum 984]